MADIEVNLIQLGEEKDSVTQYFHSIPPHDPVAKEHFWVMLLAYRVYPAASYQELNSNSLVSAQPPFCFYCEKAYDELTGRRLCFGRASMEKI